MAPVFRIRGRGHSPRRRRPVGRFGFVVPACVLAAGGGAARVDATPVVVGTSPADQAIGAPLATDVAISFAASLDPSTVIPANVLVTSSQQGTHAAAVAWNGVAREIVVNPTNDFLPGERVTVTLGKGLHDALGQPLPNGWHFEFTTWTAAVPGGGFATSDTTWPIGSIAFNLTVGDLTGDGLPEAVFSNVVPDSLTILSPDGFGRFAVLAVIGRPDATLPRHVAIGDLDADGRPDLVCCASGPSKIEVIRNLGGGQFAPAVQYATGQTPYGAYLGDLDADGDLDVASANFNSHTVSVLVNQGGGALAPFVDYPAGPGADSPRCVDGADLDGDGDIDLVCCNGYSYDVSVLLNDGTGVFAAQSPLYPVGDGPQYIELRDVTGDRIVDAVTVNSLAESISVLRGNGDGTFQAAVSAPVAGQFPYGLSIADVDGDGDLDAVLPIRGANAWQIVRNDGSGAFTAGELRYGGTHCHTAGVADWDRDGDIDVVAGFAISKNMYYYSQRPAPAVLAVSPPRNASGVSVDAPVRVDFSVDLAPATLVPSAFTLGGSQSGPHVVSVAWSPAQRELTLAPAAPFFPGEVVTLVIEANAIESAEGVPFPGDLAQFMTAGLPSSAALSPGASVPLPASDPVDVVAADLDADGRCDLAVANLLSGTVTLLLTAGSPVPVNAGSVAAGSAPVALQAADLDADGDVDLAVADLNAAAIIVLRNAAGVLTPQTPAPLGSAPFALGAGDLDRDGDVDLAVAIVTPPGVRVLKNQGSATFAAADLLPTPVPPTDVGVADLDRDGNLDVVAVLAQLDRVDVFLTSPTGFRAAATFSTGDTPMGVAAWDANGDGAVDLVCSAYTDGAISLLSNTGDGMFAPPLGLPAAMLPRGVWAGELTGDGVLDVVAANSGAGTISILRGLGGGQFDAPLSVATGTTPYAVTGGDFDGNGRVDLAVVNRASGDLTFEWNEAPSEVETPLTTVRSGIVGAWPNPFWSSVTIRFALAAAVPARLDVYDVRGRSVARLLDRDLAPPGPRSVVWDGRDRAGRRVASGVYFLKLEAAGERWTRRVLRVR
jgi:hypothetical protein